MWEGPLTDMISTMDYETLWARYAGTAMLQYHLDTRQVLPGTVEEFLAADARPVEELFFLTDSPQTKQALRQCLADLPGIGFADPFPNDLEVIAGEIDKGEAEISRRTAGYPHFPGCDCSRYGSPAPVVPGPPGFG